MSSARASIGRLQSRLAFIPDEEPEPEASIFVVKTRSSYRRAGGSKFALRFEDQKFSDLRLF